MLQRFATVADPSVIADRILPYLVIFLSFIFACDFSFVSCGFTVHMALNSLSYGDLFGIILVVAFVNTLNQMKYCLGENYRFNYFIF